MKKGFWSLPALNSRTDRVRVTLPEMIFGYFLGPLLVLAMTSVVSTYYLTFYRTYDDIVSQGAFLVLLPLVSVIPMALSNIVVGIVLGKTRTVQGKARPGPSSSRRGLFCLSPAWSCSLFPTSLLDSVWRGWLSPTICSQPWPIQCTLIPII